MHFMSVRLGQLKQDSSHDISNFPPLIPHSYRWGPRRLVLAAEKWPGNKNRSVKYRRVGKGPRQKKWERRRRQIRFCFGAKGRATPKNMIPLIKRVEAFLALSLPLSALSCLSVGYSPVGTCCFLEGEICSDRTST